MAARRPFLCSLISFRHFSGFLDRSKALETFPLLCDFPSLPPSDTIPPHSLQKCGFVKNSACVSLRGFSTTTRQPPRFNMKREEEEDDDDEEDNGGDEDEDDEEDDDGNDDNLDEESAAPDCEVERERSDAEKVEEAAAIGYRVIGQLQPSERVVKRWKPVFSVIQIGSHQFKVCIGDCIYTEKLKWCKVNDKLVLNKVLMLGSQTRTTIGRPTLPDAEVCAIVEEHAKDAKVIIFKKKRRKNYRRTKGHRQELTRLRITSIRGVDIPHDKTMAV